MQIEIPDFCLVILIGASSAEKSTFVQREFSTTEIVSSDTCRSLVADDENDQSTSADTFELVHRIAAMRLKRRRLTVIDATNMTPDARRPLLRIARDHYSPAVAIVIDVPEELAQERNRESPDRDLPPDVIHKHNIRLPGSGSALREEGFYQTYFISGENLISTIIIRQPLPTDRRDLSGPFDFIGDVHGCADELEALLEKLGYQKIPADPQSWQTYPYRYSHRDNRTLLFVGDLVDRGPRILDTCQLVYNTVKEGEALAVLGNHDDKLLRWMKGQNVKIAHGLENTLAEIAALSDDIRERLKDGLRDFFENLQSHYWLDGGCLAVAHAGIKEGMLGRWGSRVRDFSLYGETSGETDEFNLPVRYNWAVNYLGRAKIIYGHTPVVEPEWLNNTINIDSGCVFGGRLTALRYPELQWLSVQSLRRYSEPGRPLGTGVVDPPQSQ